MPGTAIAIGSAIYGGGKALGLWGKPPKQEYTQTKDERDYWDLMKKRSTQGMGAGAQFGIVNRGSAAASNAYQNALIANQGRYLQNNTQGVSSREMEKVGQEQLIRTMADISAGAEEKNELFKIASQDQLGKMGMDRSKMLSDMAYQNAMAKYGAKQEGITQLFSGLDAITTSLSAGSKATLQQLLKKGGNYTKDEIAQLRAIGLQSSDPDAFFESLYIMKIRGIYPQGSNTGTSNIGASNPGAGYAGFGLNNQFTLGQ